VNAELLRYGPEVQDADAMALLAEPVVELEGRLAGPQAKRQRFLRVLAASSRAPYYQTLSKNSSKLASASSLHLSSRIRSNPKITTELS
jgi:hypothetical protein